MFSSYYIFLTLLFSPGFPSCLKQMKIRIWLGQMSGAQCYLSLGTEGGAEYSHTDVFSGKLCCNKYTEITLQAQQFRLFETLNNTEKVLTVMSDSCLICWERRGEVSCEEFRDNLPLTICCRFFTLTVCFAFF